MSMIFYKESLEKQKNLIKTALLATDNYLGILDNIKKNKAITQPLIFEFTKNISIAYDTLKSLDVISSHESYINKIIDEMNQCIDSYKPENNNTSFKNFIHNIDNTLSENDIEEMINKLKWEDIYDLYDEDELIYDPDPDDLEEKISASQRIKKSQSMKRRTSQLSIARNLKLRRTSSIDVLKKRAVNAARRAVYKKLLMGRNKSQLSASEKDALEKRLKNFKYMQNTIAIKMLPKLKAIEQSRLAHRSKKK